MKKVLEMGVLLSAERDMDRLLDQILSCAMDLARCDGGTLYLLDGDVLRFKIMRTDSLGTRSGRDGRAPDLPPVRLSRDPRYFQDKYQGMPLDGYTPMFEKMLDHPNITLELNTDALKRLKLEDGRILLDGEPFGGTVIYSGQADELFGFRFGPLPYRTLDFGFQTLPQDAFQTHGTVNYTVDQPYTRITEFKHLTGQELPGVTTIMKEYSRAYTGADGEIPYYAVINPDNNALYAKYKAEADKFPGLRLLGRLAEYKYYNMDAIAARALTLADGML